MDRQDAGEVVGRRYGKENSETTTGTAVLTEESTETKRLTAEEERILRMRGGASVDPDEGLESKLDGE